jgi:antirestriction protein
MEKKQPEIRIYVACLAAYNAGILHGVWIDATQDAEAMGREVAAMLAASPVAGAEEYAIHDYEGFEGAPISEYQGLESVSEIAAFIERHGTLGAKLIEHFGSLEDAAEVMEDRYCGAYASLEDFVQQITEETMEVPERLAPYIDYARIARDLEINDVLSIEGKRCSDRTFHGGP